MDTSQLSSVTNDCGAPSAELVSEVNHISTESDTSQAYTGVTSLPVVGGQPNNEDTPVPAEVEAVVSFFLILFPPENKNKTKILASIYSCSDLTISKV